MQSSGMLGRVALVRADVVSTSPILVTLMMETMRSFEIGFLQEPHGETSQVTAFFIVTAAKTSMLIYI
jgi:hypothetical protein